MSIPPKKHRPRFFLREDPRLQLPRWMRWHDPMITTKFHRKRCWNVCGVCKTSITSKANQYRIQSSTIPRCIRICHCFPRYNWTKPWTWMRVPRLNCSNRFSFFCSLKVMTGSPCFRLRHFRKISWAPRLKSRVFTTTPRTLRKSPFYWAGFKLRDSLGSARKRGFFGE